MDTLQKTQSDKLKKVTVPFTDMNGQNCVNPDLMEMGWNGEHITNESEHFYLDTENRCLLNSEKHKQAWKNRRQN